MTSSALPSYSALSPLAIPCQQFWVCAAAHQLFRWALLWALISNSCSPMANMMNSVSCDNFVFMTLLYVFLLSSCESYVCILDACLASDVCFVDTGLLLCDLSFHFSTLVFKSRLCHSGRPAWLELAWPSFLCLLCASVIGMYCHSQLFVLLLHIVDWLCMPLIPALKAETDGSLSFEAWSTQWVAMSRISAIQEISRPA